LLDHLNDIEFTPDVLDDGVDSFTPIQKATPAQILDAQVKTADWLKELGVEDDEDVIEAAEKAAAQNAFAAVTADTAEAKSALLSLTVPAAVRQTVAMLTAYDWEFVQQAKQLRGMAVKKIVDETDHPDARIRLKALELLGKVTEVGLFTERVEVKKAELEDHELDERIREKLQALQKTVEAEAIEREERNADAEDVEVQESSDEDAANDGQ